MKKIVTLVPLPAASLGLVACDKKEEDKVVAPTAPATEIQLGAPAVPPVEPSAPASSSDTPATLQTPAPTSE